jgi:hypothetical protein
MFTYYTVIHLKSVEIITLKRGEYIFHGFFFTLGVQRHSFCIFGVASTDFKFL